MALSDVQPSSWYDNWQNAAQSLGWQYRDEGDYSRWALPGGGEEGAPAYMTFNEQGQPREIDSQKAYRNDLARQGYVPYSSMDEIQQIAQVAKDAYGRPFYGDVNAFLNYGFGPGTTVVQDPVHGLLVKAGDPQKAIEPSAVIYPQQQGDGSFLDKVFDLVGTVGPILAPSLLVGPWAEALKLPQFGAISTGAGPLADYAARGALQSVLRGQDPITGALTSGISGGISDVVSPQLKEILSNVGVTDPTAQKAILSGLTSGVKAEILGGDPLASALTSAAGQALPQAIRDLMPAPVEDATYSPSDQVTADYGQGYPQLAGADTGTMTDVSAGTTGQIDETPQDLLRIEETQQGQPNEADVYASGQKIKDAITSIISFGQSHGIPIDGPNLAALGATVFGGMSSTGTPEFSILNIGGTFYLKDLTSDLSYAIVQVGDSVVLQNPETNIQIELDPDSSRVLDSAVKYASEQNLIQSGSAQDTTQVAAGGWVSGEELPAGGTPSETPTSYAETPMISSAGTAGETAPVPTSAAPSESVLTSETGQYQYPLGEPFTYPSSTTQPATAGGSIAGPAAGTPDQTLYAPGQPSNIPGIFGIPDPLGIPGVYGEPSGSSGTSGLGESGGTGGSGGSGETSGQYGTGIPGETVATMPVPEPGETFQPTPDEGQPITEPLADSGGISSTLIGRYTTPTSRRGISPTSTAYLARGIVGSPEITGSPVFGTEKGKRRKVWNIESLREALGI